MLIPAGLIYTVKVEQSLFGQTVLNLFHYSINSPLPGPNVNSKAYTLWTAFREDILPQMRLCQSSDLKYVSIEVFNAVTYEDRYFAPEFSAGEVSIGGSDSSFVAFAFKLVRAYNHTRNGSKRIAGVPDNYVVGNNYTGSTVELNNLAEYMGTPIQTDDVLGMEDRVFTPCIAHRTDQIPFTIDYGNPVAFAQYRGITSQVSRKKGKGI